MTISHLFPAENAMASSSAFLLRRRGVRPATVWPSSMNDSLLTFHSASAANASLHDDDTALTLCLSLLRHLVKLLLRFDTRPSTQHSTCSLHVCHFQLLQLTADDCKTCRLNTEILAVYETNIRLDNTALRKKVTATKLMVN